MYVKKGTPCALPGCDRVHYGRSKYCSEHVQLARGHSDERLSNAASLTLARAVLTAPDLPQRLNPPQPYTFWNPVTTKKTQVYL